MVPPHRIPTRAPAERVCVGPYTVAAALALLQVQMRDLFVENDGMDDLRGEVHLWCLKRRPTPPGT